MFFFDLLVTHRLSISSFTVSSPNAEVSKLSGNIFCCCYWIFTFELITAFEVNT